MINECNFLDNNISLCHFQVHSKTNRKNRIEEASVLSKKLGGITIAAKGEVDIITNGEIGNYMLTASSVEHIA